jgi:ribosomal-protein-alanine N-acetyltransferase
MPTRTRESPAAGKIVHLRAPRASDAQAFVDAARASKSIHRGFVSPPITKERFLAFAKRNARRLPTPTHVGFLVVRNDDNALAGVFTFSEIVRGVFQSTYLGYYAFAPHAGSGCMSEGLGLALDYAFRTQKLHRVEVNIQPNNVRSLALVERAGFVREGYSKRYVKIAGRWRDHVRYAMLAEDWRMLRRTRAGKAR